jgi:hypothetical protein
MVIATNTKNKSELMEIKGSTMKRPKLNTIMRDKSAVSDINVPTTPTVIL